MSGFPNQIENAFQLFGPDERKPWRKAYYTPGVKRELKRQMRKAMRLAWKRCGEDAPRKPYFHGWEW